MSPLQWRAFSFQLQQQNTEPAIAGFLHSGALMPSITSGPAQTVTPNVTAVNAPPGAVLTPYDPSNVAITGGAITGVGTGKMPTYTGVVATRCAQPVEQLSASFTQLQGRTRHIAMDNIRSLQLVYVGWLTTGTAELNMTGTSVITVGIEYPIGTFTQVKFGGSVSGSLTGGQTLISDPCSVSIPIGAAFYVRIYQTNPSGCIDGSTGGSGTGEALNAAASGLVDTSMGGAITNTFATRRFPPIAIIGSTNRPSFAIYGDSRAMAASGVDAANDPSVNQGEVERSLGKRFAYTNVAQGGERLSQAASGGIAKRALLATYASHVICQYGINDVTFGRTAPQMLADYATVRAFFPGKPFFLCTIAPVSTSTDAWATTVNQTTHANNAVRVSVNGSIRTALTGTVDGYMEHADAVESARDSGIWKAPGFTADGTHETTAGMMAIKATTAYDDTLSMLV